MVKKKIVRKTLKEKLAEAETKGFDAGVAAGRELARADFQPNWTLRESLTDFTQQIRGWPIGGADVVMLVGTDLKHICNMAVPARTMKAIAGELERLGYKR